MPANQELPAPGGASDPNEQGRAGAGNTEKAPAPPQYTYWFFTWNNYGGTEQAEQLEQVLKHECNWFVFQEERGESGTPHLQGTIALKKKQRKGTLKAINAAIHWEPTKAVKKSVEYCSKEKTRDGRQWIHGIEIAEELKLVKPWGWQLEVLRIIETGPDDRTIHWFWDAAGNKGKTQLAKYLAAKHNALMVSGKSTDMFHALACNPSKRKLILVCVPRSAQDFVNYGAIEMIKDGLVFSGKYEGAQLVFNSPIVLVFANHEPDKDKMSMDRWKIVNVDELIANSGPIDSWRVTPGFGVGAEARRSMEPR